jgi:hypothetical protein
MHWTENFYTVLSCNTTIDQLHLQQRFGIQCLIQHDDPRAVLCPFDKSHNVMHYICRVCPDDELLEFVVGFALQHIGEFDDNQVQSSSLKY